MPSPKSAAWSRRCAASCAPSHVQVFSEVTPEPDEATIRRGVALLKRVQPDLLIAVGGGSVLDAGKAIRLFYEHPEKSLDELTMPFLDPRKRVADYPVDRHRVQLVAVPTTSGTGSEVSPAAVLTVRGKKETLVDYSLVPDLAIVDPVLTSSMPQKLTADTGIDALTHALEACVSIFASPYTDALCAQAARLIFDALPRSFEHPDDLSARTDMSNAATLAGLAFSNAFVGTNHALAHAVGARFGISHGRANGIFLPHVLRYNASLPSKFMPAPGYSAYVAPDKYAQLGRLIFGGHEPDECRSRLFRGVDDLLNRLDMPRSLREHGVDEQEFLAALPALAMTAFEDLSNRTNPRMPLVSEIPRCFGRASTAMPKRKLSRGPEAARRAPTPRRSRPCPARSAARTPRRCRRRGICAPSRHVRRGPVRRPRLRRPARA